MCLVLLLPSTAARLLSNSLCGAKASIDLEAAEFALDTTGQGRVTEPETAAERGEQRQNRHPRPLGRRGCNACQDARRRGGGGGRRRRTRSGSPRRRKLGSSVERRLRARELALELLDLAARRRLGQRRCRRAAAVEFLFELLHAHRRGYHGGEIDGFHPTRGAVGQADLGVLAVDAQGVDAGSGMQGGKPLALAVLFGVDAEHEFIADEGGRRAGARCRQHQHRQQGSREPHAAIPVCLSSARTSGSRPRNRTKASIASKLPPLLRIESRKRVAVAPSNTPASSKASNASAARTSAHL